MNNLDPKRARWIRLRMGLLCGAMALTLGGFVSSAYRVQVEDGPVWREIAEKQRQRRLHIEPKRGTIFDRKGTALAVSVDVPSLSADIVEMLRGIDSPQVQIDLLKDASSRIAQALSLDANELYSRLVPRRRFVWIKRRITGDEAAAVRDLGDAKKQVKPIRGLNIEGEGHRYYPDRELAGPVLGFVAPDGAGKDGLELALDEDLHGHMEEIKGLRDRSGHLLFSDGVDNDDALAGHNIYLTLDEGIQHVAERELDIAFRTYETKGASLLALDPNTGEILALASSPGYNPNDYGESDVEARRNRAISDRFEPGSAMKVFTIAAALASGALKPTEAIFCEHGSYQIGAVTIHDTHLNDWLTPTQVIAKSSNIGALKIGLNLGETGLYSAFRRFGFGEPTGIPLPGEAAGVLRPKGRPWYEVETANASFGQGVSVTTIQLAMALATIANGGRLLEPLLVRKVTDARGNVVREGMPRVRREVVSAAVAKLVTEMLTAVTEEGGTGVEAAVPGFRVAGKTATAQKADPSNLKYAPDKFTSSFIGFVPAERPRLLIAIVLDEPMIGHYGGDLAGPVFRRVAEAGLRYLGVVPSPGPPKVANYVRVSERNLSRVDRTAGSPPALTDPGAAPLAAGAVHVPDGIGLAAREAVREISQEGLVPQVEGTGRLMRQIPPPGTAVPKGSVVRLVFEPAS